MRALHVRMRKTQREPRASAGLRPFPARGGASACVRVGPEPSEWRCRAPTAKLHCRTLINLHLHHEQTPWTTSTRYQRALQRQPEAWSTKWYLSSLACCNFHQRVQRPPISCSVTPLYISTTFPQLSWHTLSSYTLIRQSCLVDALVVRRPYPIAIFPNSHLFEWVTTHNLIKCILHKQDTQSPTRYFLR